MLASLLLLENNSISYFVPYRPELPLPQKLLQDLQVWILLPKEAKTCAPPQIVHVGHTLHTRSHNKISITPLNLAAAAVTFMFQGWSISMSHRQSLMLWLMHQMLHLRIPKCLQNTEASTTVQHVHLGHTPTMCSHLLGVIHSSLQHSWSMLTVVVNLDLLMGIFTSHINRPHPDQLLSWQHIHHLYYCDLFSLSICNNIRWDNSDVHSNLWWMNVIPGGTTAPSFNIPWPGLKKTGHISWLNQWISHEMML